MSCKLLHPLGFDHREQRQVLVATPESVELD
jgi:hypothetical protein